MNRITPKGLLALQRIARITGKKNRTHGESSTKRTPEYRAWESMKYRCSNMSNPHWKLYGGRGISVCKTWFDSYECFLKDMGRKPGKEYSLDRINNNGNYEPSNCRWATKKQQAQNRRFTERPRLPNGTFAKKEYK
jgi:hypothetical protein